MGAFSLAVAPSLLNHVGRASVGSTDVRWHMWLWGLTMLFSPISAEDADEAAGPPGGAGAGHRGATLQAGIRQAAGRGNHCFTLLWPVLGTVTLWHNGDKLLGHRGQVGREEGRYAGEEQLDRLPASISVSSVVILEAKCVWKLLCSLTGAGLSWEVRNKAVLKYQMAHPVLSSAQLFSGRECLWSLKPLSLPEHEGKGSGT